MSRVEVLSRPVFGACLLSAAGSLIPQSLPLYLTIAYGQGGASLLGAGWLAGMLFLGQVIASFCAPVLRPGGLRLREILAVALLAQVLLLVSAGPATGLRLAVWLGLGAASGALQYMGMLVAARGPNPGAAFSVRLSLSMALSALVLMTTLARPGISLPAAMLFTQVLQGGVVLVAVGLMLSAPAVVTAIRVTTARPRLRELWRDAAGVGRLALWIVPFFGGVIAFLNYLPVLAEDAFPAMSIVAILGAARLAAAVTIFGLHRIPAQVPRRAFFVAAPLLACATVELFQVGTLAVAVVALCLFEIAVNMTCARFLGEVSLSARHVSQWLTALVQMGVALSQVVTAYMAGTRGEEFFALALLATFFLPAIWSIYAARGLPEPRRR
ncbi:hypothetical protein [Roseivivax marinus]|uniref:hypothetical protein n=1 Tax=Roseivivax marinus TaxID=1379903 RepID=UPI00273F134C|nr:hypothetical protein [Roseivivax marinus]